MPPLTVIGMVGAFGKTKLISGKDLTMLVCWMTWGNQDQPSPESPSPWINIMADLAVDDAWFLMLVTDIVVLKMRVNIRQKSVGFIRSCNETQWVSGLRLEGRCWIFEDLGE